MKHCIFFLIWTLGFSTLGYAQELEQDTDSKRWHYTKVFEANGVSASKLYKRTLNNYVPQANIIQSTIENEKVVIRYQFRLGTFKYAKVTETFDIKDGRIRWRLSDIVYLKAVTNLSKYKKLDNTHDKKIIKKINKLLSQAIKDVEDKIIKIPLEKDDW
ncbi:hypothetical protein [Winogradskyella luteola]|uniref:DUF4468 domain-containing protein n=1 Tax=Winogradskyella luteola TaxID=2828330 RepID=A0A9X1FAZ5_9FLAO|nr:hypothetical protein [Winogradskyella luteola]MBV7270709.1 hypothetical protein [Winogradskyella luteola]